MRHSKLDPGAVLSGGEILELSSHGRQLIDRLEPESVRGAAYELGIGDRVITPAGELNDLEPSQHGLTLRPGESAVFRTRERLTLPPTLAGNLTLKTHLASQGLLLLSGILIDPGYSGYLHLCLANLSSSEIPIRAGDKVAAVQFFPVFGEAISISTPQRSNWERQFNGETKPTAPPTFLYDLRRLRVEHDELAKLTRETANFTTNVVTLGFVLVSATIIGIVFDIALTVGSNSSAVSSLRHATPHSWPGVAVLVSGLLVFAWIVTSAGRSLARIANRRAR